MNHLSALTCRFRFRLVALASASLLLMGPALAAPALKWSTTVDSGATASDRTKAVGITSNGDVIAAFQIASATGAQIRVQRLASSTGTAAWTRDVGTAGLADDVVAISVDPVTGNTFVAARSASAANGLDWLVFKVNGSDGTLGWGSNYTFSTVGNDQPRAITITSDANIAVAGMETNPVNGSSRLRVTKINASTGVQIWNYTDLTDGTDALALAADLPGGNVIAAGTKGMDAFVVKLGSTGSSGWSQTYNGVGAGYDAWNAITVLSTGDLAVAGYVTGATGGQNFAVARYSVSGGSPAWVHEVNGTANGDDAAFDLAKDSSDNLYAAGLLRDTTKGQTGYIAKLAAASGTELWSASKNGTSSATEATDALFSVCVLGGDVLAAGTQADAANKSNILVSRYSTAGSFMEDTVFDGPAHNLDLLLTKNLVATSGTNLFAIGGDSENASAVSNGLVRAFIVPKIPTVTTPTVASITSTTSTLGGNVTTDGAATITARGVVLAKTATNNNPQLGGSGVTTVTGSGTTGVFTVSASNLVPGTAYSFAAYATNSVGTAYSSIGSFTTLTPIENWRQTWYGTPGNTGNAADGASPYGTGIPNLAVFAFLGPSQNPALAKISQLPQTSLSGGKLSSSFTPPVGVSGITYGAQSSTTLLPGSWQAVTNTGVPPQQLFSVPAGAGSKLFLRLKVTNP